MEITGVEIEVDHNIKRPTGELILESIHEVGSYETLLLKGIFASICVKEICE